jgi:hypothetical protein
VRQRRIEHARQAEYRTKVPPPSLS